MYSLYKNEYRNLKVAEINIRQGLTKIELRKLEEINQLGL
jgi:hypothetical protein